MGKYFVILLTLFTGAMMTLYHLNAVQHAWENGYDEAWSRHLQDSVQWVRETQTKLDNQQTELEHRCSLQIQDLTHFYEEEIARLRQQFEEEKLALEREHAYILAKQDSILQDSLKRLAARLQNQNLATVKDANFNWRPWKSNPSTPNRSVFGLKPSLTIPEAVGAYVMFVILVTIVGAAVQGFLRRWFRKRW